MLVAPNAKTTEARIEVPVFGDEPGLKGVSSFVSNIERENKLYVDEKNPSPDAYYPVSVPKYMIRGRIQDGFGTDAARESLLHRDVAKSPFKNPTYLENPGSDTYKAGTMFLKLKPQDETITATGLPQSVHGTQPSAFYQHKHQQLPKEHQELKRTNASYLSTIDRNFLKQIPKDVQESPGPGSYVSPDK